MTETGPDHVAFLQNINVHLHFIAFVRPETPYIWIITQFRFILTVSKTFPGEQWIFRTKGL